MICLLLLLLPSVVHSNNWEYVAQQYIENGVEVPYTLRSLITCTIPGINLLYCMGPRVQAVKSSETVYGRRPYLRNGLHNGVDLRFLKMMGLQRKTEIGRTIGAGVAIGPRDGEVEFGDRYDVLDLWTMNRGGNVAFDHHGGGVDVGTRMQAADNLIRIHETNFGVEYADRYRPPFRRTLAKGAALKGPTLESIYPGYRYSDNWYQEAFIRPSIHFIAYLQMPNKVYFEVAWDNKHFFLDCEPATTVEQVKKIIGSCYPDLDVNELVLAWKPKDGAWTGLEDVKTLGANGLTTNNSPAESPSFMGFLRKGETEPNLDSLSEPPELPDHMRIAND
ncbi:hypothetical protein PENTCL1PPCAC_10770, partial [Pristionchus entomophagus]